MFVLNLSNSLFKVKRGNGGFMIFLWPINQPCLKKGVSDFKVSLFKGDLGGSKDIILASMLVKQQHVEA
jgi:hypothetical protein